MVNSNLEYLADCIIIEALVDNDVTLKSFAQDGGIGSSVASGVKDYVSSLWDPERPVASVMAFLGPGILWSTGFKWLSILYTVAEALGVDWIGFWETVKNGVKDFLEQMLPKGKIPEDILSSKTNTIVSDAWQQHSTGKVDKQKLQDIATGKVKMSFEQKLQETLEVKSIALQLEKNPKLMKNAGLMSLFRGKMARFFLGTISWLIKTAFISLGLTAVVGAAKGLLGDTKNVSSPSGSKEEDFSKQPVYGLQMSQEVAPELLTVHNNDMNAVWLEKGNIGDIDNVLVSWVLSAFPQFQSHMPDLKSSSVFQSVINKFKNRNRLAAGLGFFSVPRPYMRKIDIVSEIVNGFMKERKITSPPQQEAPGQKGKGEEYEVSYK